MNKIVLAIDSFKGCLTSSAVETAAGEGVHDILPQCEVECVPIADGGEGMLEVMVHLTRGRYVEVDVHDPLMRTIKGRYGVTGDNTTAIIEMAQASGLPLLAENERNPMIATSYGTGELIKHALSSGFRNLLIGIGGSATNDAGMGMMQALGAQFYDNKGNELSIGCGKLLSSVETIDIENLNRNIEGCTFSTACDVNNPFFGKEGAAYTFARQKGADDEQIFLLDEGMRHFAKVVKENFGVDLSVMPGTGAAGGMGGALTAFFRSCLQPGIDLILEKIGFEQKIEGAELIITGEGKADQQTLMGKVPAGVLKYGKRKDIPVVLMAGAVDRRDILLQAGFAGVYAVTPKDQPLSEALKSEVAKENIRCRVGQIVKEMIIG